MNLALKRKQSASEAGRVATMRAAVIVAPRTVEIAEFPIPSPGPDQVCVQLEGCGVCASNVPVWEGRPWFEYPRPAGSPGHEAWGRIHAKGSGVEGLKLGDRVACLSYQGFAEYDLADANAVVPLPAELSPVPFPAEPLACAVNVFRRARIEPGQQVVVVGIGFLGALLVQLTRAAGAQAIAVSRRPSSLEIARACGATAAVPLGSIESTRQELAAAAGSAEFPCVIEATGSQAGLDAASELVAVRGRLVIAGYHQDGTRQVDMQSWNWRGIDVINAHEREAKVYREGMELAVQKVLAGEIEVERLLTHQFPLEELGAALEIASQRPDDFVKSVVTCGESLRS